MVGGSSIARLGATLCGVRLGPHRANCDASSARPLALDLATVRGKRSVGEGPSVTEPTTTWRSHRPRREDVVLGLVVAILIVGVAVCGSAIEIAHTFQPQGSLLGRPMRIPTCGQTYTTSPEVTTVYTRAEIEAAIAAGLTPLVIEPVIGQIPPFAPFAGPQHPAGAQPCDTLIYLHVGADAYAAYGREVRP